MTKEIIRQLEVLKSKIKSGAFAIPAAKELEGRMARRIFLQGKNSAGTAIGQYSTKPLYISLKRREFNLLPAIKKLKGQGKPTKRDPKGKTNFADGRPLVSHYFAGGYREFRQVAGRQPKGKIARLGGKATDGINLNLTGSLAQSFTTGIASERVSIGFTSKKVLTNALSLEKRFGAVFDPTKDEIKAFRAAYIADIRRFLPSIKK